jgi:DNA-binding transcriptional LysR family regulator
MNLRQIEVFHAVYSTGSISSASRLLNVSQPSVSKIVKHTESRLGYALFRLVKGRLLPTDEAHILFGEVDDLQTRIGTFQRTARNLKSTSSGHIRMGVLPSLALSITPQVIARFRRRLPDVTFEVFAIHHNSFRQALTARDCDFVIGHHLLPDPEVATVSLGRGRVGALFQPAVFPLSEEGGISLSTLRKHEVIGFSPGVAIADLVGPAVYPSIAVRPAVTVRSVYMAAAMARQGAGIAIVDEFTARGFVGGGLDFLPIAPAVSFELKALHLAEQPLSRIAQSFLDLKRLVMSEPVAAPLAGDPAPCPQAMGVDIH